MLMLVRLLLGCVSGDRYDSPSIEFKSHCASTAEFVSPIGGMRVPTGGHGDVASNLGQLVPILNTHPVVANKKKVITLFSVHIVRHDSLYLSTNLRSRLSMLTLFYLLTFHISLSQYTHATAAGRKAPPAT